MINESENKTFLSVVVPAYNEGKKIRKNILRIHDYLESQKYSCEILVVDDGSSDNTLSKLNQLAKEIPLSVFTGTKNRGKGYAVRKGMLEAKGEFSLFLDADLSTGIEELPKVLEAFKEGNEIVVGSRRLNQSVVLVHQNFCRKFLGSLFTRLTNFLIAQDISDVTCGFKAFSGRVAKDIFYSQKIFGWSFDAEILYLARYKGYRLKEIPVTWRNESNSKVRMVRDVIGSLAGLIMIKINIMQGKYGGRKG